MTNRQIALLAASIRRSTRPSWSSDTPEYVLIEADEYLEWLERDTQIAPEELSKMLWDSEIKPLRFNQRNDNP